MQKPDRIEIIAVFHDEVNKYDVREVLRTFKSDDSDYKYWFDDLEGFFEYERDKEMDMFTYLPWGAGQYRLKEMGVKDYFDDRFEEMMKAGFTGASIGVKFVWEELNNGLYKD